MRRIRVQVVGGPAAGWAGNVSWRLFEERFAITDRRPDIVVLQIVDESARALATDLAPSQKALELGRPVAAISTLDRDHAITAWDRTWRSLLGEADLVIGHQLPLSIGDRGVPLLYPPRPELVSPRPYAGTELPLDLSFVGDFSAEVDADHPWPSDVRSRECRGIALQRLAAGLPERRLLFRNIDYWYEYWRTDTETVRRRHREYAATMGRSTMIFAPPGYGYNTYRHAEAWRQQRLVLSPPLHERILMPEPELWAQEALSVHYRWDGSDLVDTARWALDYAEELADRVQTGHGYYRRWGTREAQINQIEQAFLALLS
ncbi:MAG: hypothetical protein ACYDHH_04180 [Solirubrobacteraceae bacterium]